MYLFWEMVLFACWTNPRITRIANLFILTLAIVLLLIRIKIQVNNSSFQAQVVFPLEVCHLTQMRWLWRSRLHLSGLSCVKRHSLLCHIMILMCLPWVCFVFSSNISGPFMRILGASWWGARADNTSKAKGCYDGRQLHQEWGNMVMVRNTRVLSQETVCELGWSLETLLSATHIPVNPWPWDCSRIKANSWDITSRSGWGRQDTKCRSSCCTAAAWSELQPSYWFHPFHHLLFLQRIIES